MSTQYTPIWINPFLNKVYAGWQNSQDAPSFVFKQGDKQQIELFLVKPSVVGGQDVLPFPDGCTIRLAIGRVDNPAIDGTMLIAFGGDTTTELAHNASASDIETALNALPSVVSAGGVTVQSISETTFQITFDSVGTQFSPVIDTSGLVPTCGSKVIEARAGSATAKAVYIIKVYQSVSVYQNIWEDSPDPALSVEVLATNRTKRVTISPIPLSGSWSLTTTPDIQTLVEEAGNTNNVPTYWTQTVTERLTAFADSFKNADGDDIWQMNVLRNDLTSWDFSVKTNYDIPVNYTMPFTVSGNFIKFPSKVGTIDLNTLEVEYLLNGAASASAMMEIEVERSTGEKWTVLQIPCTIVNDLIDQSSYTLSTLEEPVGEAPQDGSLYARRDGGWVSFTEEDNQGITQAAGDARYAQQSNNLSDLDDLTQARTNLGVYSTSQVDTALTGKANTSHTHAISDVTGLQTAIDGKADANHNHNIFNLQGQSFSGAVDGDMVRIYNPSLYGQTGANVLISRPLSWWEQPRNGQPMPNSVFQGTFQIPDGLGGYTEGNVVVTVSFSKYLNRLNTGSVSLNTSGMGTGLLLTWTTANSEGSYNYGNEYYGDTLNLEVPANDSIQYINQYSDADSGVSVSISVTSGDPSGITWGGLSFSTSNALYYFDTSRPASTDEPVMKRGLIQSFIQELNRFRAFSFTPDTTYSDYNLVWRSGTNKFELDNTLASSIASVSGSLSNYALKSGTTFTGKVNTTSTATTAPLNIAVSATAPSTTVAGDIWIGTNINFKDNTGTAKAVANTNTSNTFVQPQIVQTATTASSAALRITNQSTVATAHSIVVEDSANPDSTSFIVNNAGVVGISVNPSTWTPSAGVVFDVYGKAVFNPASINTPSLNLGATASASSPTNAVNGDIWITNVASPKLAYKTGGVNYYPAVANQFNTFTGGMAITGASASSPQLAVTQTGQGVAVQITTQVGSGHALVVEDSTNPDTNAFVIDQNGNVGIGVNPATWVATQKFEVQGNIKFSDNSVQTTAYIPSAVAITGGTIDNVVIDGGTY